jgi:hypothetical protein
MFLPAICTFSMMTLLGFVTPSEAIESVEWSLIVLIGTSVYFF